MWRRFERNVSKEEPESNYTPVRSTSLCAGIAGGWCCVKTGKEDSRMRER